MFENVFKNILIHMYINSKTTPGQIEHFPNSICDLSIVICVFINKKF